LTPTVDGKKREAFLSSVALFPSQPFVFRNPFPLEMKVSLRSNFFRKKTSLEDFPSSGEFSQPFTEWKPGGTPPRWVFQEFPFSAPASFPRFHENPQDCARFPFFLFCNRPSTFFPSELIRVLSVRLTGTSPLTLLMETSGKLLRMDLSSSRSSLTFPLSWKIKRYASRGSFFQGAFFLKRYPWTDFAKRGEPRSRRGIFFAPAASLPGTVTFHFEGLAQFLSSSPFTFPHPTSINSFHCQVFPIGETEDFPRFTIFFFDSFAVPSWVQTLPSF